MSIKTVFALFLMITFVSFLGFLVENLWLALTKGYIDNRNMTMPFLLGYGLAMVAIFLIFGIPQAPRIFGYSLEIASPRLRVLSYFLCVCFCVAVGEIALGTLVEKLCGIEWWNYTRLPLHFTKYTSVPTTVMFSVMITLFMGLCFAPLYRRFLRINLLKLAAASCTAMALMTADFLCSAWRMYKTRSLYVLWRIHLPETRLVKALKTT